MHTVESGCELLPHTQYSSDLALGDYLLFLEDERSGSDDDIVT